MKQSKMHRLLQITTSLCLLIVSFHSLPAMDGPKKTPKYLISPYVEIVSGDCYVVKIDYFRYYDVSEGFEDTYYVQGRSNSGGVAFMKTDNRNTYEDFAIDVSFNADKMAEFTDEKLFRLSAGSKKIPVTIGNKILGFLNDETDDNSSYNKRKGTLTLGYIQRLCFDVNKGQTLGEVQSEYQEKVNEDPEWITQFNNLKTLFNNHPFSYLELIGTASTTYGGDQSEATESNIDLAGKRAAAGVNFFINQMPNLAGSASYNSTNNTLSLSGAGTARVTARNGGITNTDTIDDDFYVDQCIYFRLLR